MKRPVISVCVVTFNQRAFIGQCLRSILAQEVDADVRIMVGDDASHDGTSELVAAIASERPGCIRHFIRQTQMGALANMRDLIARADGDFVARVDGDDYWLPGKLQRQLDYLHAHADCAAVYTNAITVDETGNRVGHFNDVGDGRFDLVAMLRRGNFLNNSSVLFRAAGRHAWLDVEGPQIDYRIHLWHARNGWLGHIGEPLAGYRVNTKDSMVAVMNDHVRELYWEAILSVPRDMISERDFAVGLADFLRRVIYRSIRARRLGLIRKWVPVVLAESPYPALRTMWLTILSMTRIAMRTIFWRFMRVLNGKPSHILYHY
jgi:glycosyltransferase involved in cell wall biosynthesis